MQEESPGFQLTGGHAADLSQKEGGKNGAGKGKEKTERKREKRRAFNQYNLIKHLWNIQYYLYCFVPFF